LTFDVKRMSRLLHGLGCSWLSLLPLFGCGATNITFPTLPDAASQCSVPSVPCPSPAPSYQSEVEPVLQARCLSCHSPGGVGTPELNSYGLVHNNDIEVLAQLSACLMPPPDAGQLSSSERTTVLGWISCGAPNN
jgi:uncharacterized membrane protein